MDEEKKQEEQNEEISYQYMSMDTYSDEDEPSTSNDLFSIQKDDGVRFGSRKKSGLLVFLIIVILVLSIIYGVYYFKNRADNNDNSSAVTDKKEETKEEEKQPEEDKEQPNPETVVTEQKLIEMLNKKLESLDVQTDDRRVVLFEKTRRINDFGEIDLMIVGLNNVKPVKVENGRDYCYDLKTQKLEYKPSKCGYDNINNYVVAKDLEMFYKSMFGIPLDKKEQYDTCPRMLYNKEKDIYYLSSSCGGAGYPTDLTYIYKYTETVEAAYIYVAYGSMASNGDIYTDYNMKNQYKKEDYDFKITSANYNDFSKYKLVFEKKDNDLHFVYIEKLEQ